MGPENPMIMGQEIQYNGQGLKVATHINAPGGSTAVDTLIYNKNGDLTQKQRIVKGQVVRTWDYTNKKKDENKKEFDDNGKLLKLTESNGDYTTYEYDSNGNLIKELQFQEGKEHTKYTFEYDKDNLLTKMKTYLLYIGDGTTAPLSYYFNYKKNETNTALPQELFQRWKLSYGMANGVKISGLPESPFNDYEFKRDGKYLLFNEDDTYMTGSWEYNATEKAIYTKRDDGEINGKIGDIKAESITLIPAGKSVKGTPFENFRYYYVPKTE